MPDTEVTIQLSKLDIKYGLCMLVLAYGKQWYFVYVILVNPGKPNNLFIPSVLHLAWYQSLYLLYYTLEKYQYLEEYNTTE